MNIEQILHLMRHTPWNWYYVCDWAYFRPGITPEEYKESFRIYAERQAKLDAIGSSICSVLMPWWWVGIDTYDFTQFDEFVDALLKDHPDRYFVPRIKLEPPLDWMKAHPEELCVYWHGPQSAEEIRDLVGTAYHDRSGTGAAIGKGYLISNQSFSSKKWQEDAARALRTLVEHLEKGPYASQIIGYMPAFGNNGECAWWGDWRLRGNPQKGDFGVSHRRDFYMWAVGKYGSLQALRQAWDLPELTIDNIPIPTADDRWSIHDESLQGVLLTKDRRQVDYNIFRSNACFDAIEYFGKTIKEVCGKAAGAFYGYLQELAGGKAGYLAIDRAVTTPYVDFYSAPKGYHYCQAGDPGASQAPAQSFARKKLWIEENDCRSHHAADKDRKTANASETQTVFWREIYRALTMKFGFWWMDIGGLRDDWYADEEMVAMFSKQAKFYKKWSPTERKNTAQVLFVVDEESQYHMTYQNGLQVGLRMRLERELRRCGAEVEHLRMADLMELDLSRYKFIVFCHAFVMPKEKWERLRKRLRPDVHVLWNYAAALLTPDYSPENQKAVTGFSVQETPDRMNHPDLYRHIYFHTPRLIAQDYPRLALVEEAGQQVLQRTPDGYVLTAQKEVNGIQNIFAADITLRTPLLRQLLEAAGVTLSAPVYCSVLADEKLKGFFPYYDVQFTHHFEGLWNNVITGETVTGDTCLKIREKQFMIFEKLD